MSPSHEKPETSSNLHPAGPRKVIVGTTIFSLFPDQRPFVSIEHRLQEVRERIDEMAADAEVRYGRGPDVLLFPENSLNPPKDGRRLEERALPLEGAVLEMLSAKAREHSTYLAVCFNMLESNSDTVVYNACVLVDREGKVAGIYRKVYCLASDGGASVEGGKRPGGTFPVFETDFGKVAMAICFDIGFEDLFAAYAAQGAELVLWPSMSPQTLLPRLYARRFGYHIVSATPRDNASVFDPVGEIPAQITEEGALVFEIDLQSRIVHWQPELHHGQALRDRYGDQVGFRYDTQEDTGIFWSNDPGCSINQMLKETGLLDETALRDLARSARIKVLGAVST